jgi:ATP-dependent DNA ligase
MPRLAALGSHTSVSRYRWNVGLTTLDMENCRWLRPRLVAQIEFGEWTPGGRLRHSSFAELQDDADDKEFDFIDIIASYRES